MPAYVAMQLVEASRIYAQIAQVFADSTAHIHVHLDQLICTCIVRFQVSGVRKEKQKK